MASNKPEPGGGVQQSKEGNEAVAIKSSPAMSRKQKEWEDKLNADKAGSQTNAEDFTKQFMQDMYKESSLTKHEDTLKEEKKQVIIGNLNL